MVISGVVFETVAGRASAVAARLANIDGLEIAGSDGDSRFAAVWRAQDGTALQRAAEQLLNAEADILGIYPTFVGND